MRAYTITKGDSKNTRNSKKKARNRLKRKDIYHQLDIPKINQRKRGKYHNTDKKPIRFGSGIEAFCSTNYSLSNNSKKLVLKLNTDFSLFNSPSKVLFSLLNLLKHAKTYQVNPQITYDGHVSFGAIYLLDNLCWQIGKKRKWFVQIKKFPKEEAYILSNLKSIARTNFEEENEWMINDRVLINRSDDPTAKQQYKVRAKQITDLIEKAIRITSQDEKYSLPLEIHSAIKSAIGEQFDNIHLHSTETDFGTLCGYYNVTKQEVTILIYNFGKTIFETLTSESLPSEIFSEVVALVQNHKKNNIFNFTKNTDFTIENAITLLSLQEGISSRIKYDISRGHGLTDFIENCFSLTEECRIAIISGKTAIKIDKTYKMEKKYTLGKFRRTLALNIENDLFKKPDPNFVLNTGINFNGVIIETVIPLGEFSI